MSYKHAESRALLRHSPRETSASRPQSRFAIKACILVLAILIFSAPASAVQLQDLVRIKGAENNQLVGVGLVVGLAGTGDGGKSLPTVRPLANIISRFVDESVVAEELKDGKNVALVSLQVNVPAGGVREGDRLDVEVSSIGAAKSLAGGRLFLIPVTGPRPGDPVFAFCSGQLTIEDPTVPTAAIIKGGAQMSRDIRVTYLNSYGQVTLVLNKEVATIPMAQTISALVNGRLAPDGPNVAKAVDQKNIVIDVPVNERTDPVAYLSAVLREYIDPTLIDTGSRVVVNQKTGTIVIKGNVQISPVIISIKDLTITTVTPPPPLGTPVPTLPGQLPPGPGEQNFIGVDPSRRGGTQLAELLSALNQLKVPAADRIAILRQMKASGDLHAELIEE